MIFVEIVANISFLILLDLLVTFDTVLFFWVAFGKCLKESDSRKAYPSKYSRAEGLL